MKLSELTTDGALDALCRLTPHITNITTDRAVVESVGKIVDTEGLSMYGMYALIMDRISEVIPILLNSHRADVYGILSVINQRTPEEIAAQNVRETFSQLRGLVQDQELIDFFKSLLGRAKKEPSAPSAPPPA